MEYDDDWEDMYNIAREKTIDKAGNLKCENNEKQRRNTPDGT